MMFRTSSVLAVCMLAAGVGCVGPGGSTSSSTTSSGGQDGSTSSTGGGGSSAGASGGTSNGTSGGSSTGASGGTSNGTSGGSSNGASGGNSSSSMATPEEIAATQDAVRQFFEASCDAEDRCAATLGRFNLDHATCVAAIDIDIASYDSYIPGGYINLLASAYTVNTANLAACVMSIRTTSACGATMGDASCDTVFVPRHTVTVGQSCDFLDGTFCAAGLRCDSAGQSQACGVCKTPKALGQTCFSGTECESDNCSNGMCAPALAAAQLNGSCADATCVSNLVCVADVAGAKKCQMRPGLGAQCVTDQYGTDECLRGSECGPMGTCVVSAHVGEVCTRDQTRGCFGGYCAFATSTAETGTCTVFSDLPSAGEACGANAECASSAYPLLSGTACTCTALGHTGDTCVPSGQNTAYRTSCQDGTCSRDAGGAYKCVARAAEGAACTSNAGCVSDACNVNADGLTRSCGAPMCMGAAACGSQPANKTPGTAAVLTLGTPASGDLCVAGQDDHQYWKVTTPIAASAGYRVRVWSAGGLSSLKVAISGTRQGVVDEFTSSTCYLYNTDGWSDCNFISPAEGAALDGLLVDLSTSSGAQSLHVNLLASAIGDGGGVCTQAEYPSNDDPSRATVFTLGQSVDGVFCSRSVDKEYHWKATGTFAQGKTYKLTASYTPSANDAFSAGPQLLLEASNGGGSVASAYAYLSNNPASPNITYLVTGTSAADTLTVTTTANPSLFGHGTIHFKLEETADGGGACPAGLPANISETTATVLTMDNTTSGKFCSRGAETEFYFKLAGPFSEDELVDVVIVATDTEYNYTSVGLVAAMGMERIHLAYCYISGSTTPSHCAGVVPAGTDALYLSSDANPSGGVERTFTVTPHEVTTPPFTCPNPPANWKRATAASFTLGMPVAGRFCSSNLPVNFWWKAAGTFLAGTQYRLSSTAASGSESLSYELNAVDAAGNLTWLQTCYPSGSTPATCDVTLFGDATELLVRTTNNVSYQTVDETFTFTVAELQ